MDHLPVLGRGHGKHPNGDQIGGGVGKDLIMNLGDAALPNGSKIQAVNLGIDQILATDAYGNVTIVAQYTSPQVVDVLAYQGGNTTPIADGNVTSATYTSLTIVVDTATSNYVGGTGNVHSLSFQTGATRSSSGFGASTTTAAGPNPGTVAITFKKSFAVSGSSMNIDVDFNALESLDPASTSSGGSSRPSLTVAQEGVEGAIAGNVLDAAGSSVSNAVVVAIASDGSTAATGVTDSNGAFLLHTLNAGSYRLAIYNQYLTASGWQVDSQNSSSSAPAVVQGPSASVTNGQTTSVGTVQD
jgi:hypothetical protein